MYRGRGLTSAGTLTASVASLLLHNRLNSKIKNQNAKLRYQNFCKENFDEFINLIILNFELSF